MKGNNEFFEHKIRHLSAGSVHKFEISVSACFVRDCPPYISTIFQCASQS